VNWARDVGRAILRQWNRHHLAADGDLVVGERVLDPERELEIGSRAASLLMLISLALGSSLSNWGRHYRSTRQVVGNDRP
jgi:hypothetical protein